MDTVGMDRSADPAARQMLAKAAELNVRTGWDRHEEMQDPCAFGELGLCCRHCMMGPCRIDPFGEGPQKGICGIGPDAMVARNLCRMVAAGTSAHSDHAAHILEVVKLVSAGKARDFRIQDPRKLRAIAGRLGLDAGGEGEGGVQAVLERLIPAVEQAFLAFGGGGQWMARTVSRPRLDKLGGLRVLPEGIDAVIRETLHRTHMGVGADPLNLLLGALKCSLADFLGMDVASSLTDALLGTPSPVFSQANLGVLDADSVNVAVHGHNPLVCETILQVRPEFEEKAKALGAAKGINIVGVCCTGNEVLMRHGVPLATNAASQELAILTGAVDAMVVDVQCVMPSLADVCECFHTRLITTMSIAKIPGALHVEFDPHNARASAAKVLEEALAAYAKRDPRKVDIPNVKQETMVGFSDEAIVEVLAKLDPEDPLRPLVDALAADDIHGIVLFAGCNNYKVPQDSSFLYLAERLAADNVLMLATGCAAGAMAKGGLLSPEATPRVCGERLRRVLTALGAAAGVGRPLPPVWHMGSCVDNSRAARLCFALADKLGVDIDALPVVASAPEAMSEKAVAIGTWAVALGLTTHLGVVPPVLGGKVVTKLLTETAKDLLGACFIIETDPKMAHERIKETLAEKRLALHLS